MKIGILRTDTVRPEFARLYGEYPDMFETLLKEADPDLEFVTYHVEAGEYPADINEVDAYLITGSKSSVYEDKDWIKILQAFVVRLDEAQIKTIGICFGHQLIAQALGGETRKADIGWGVGAHPARWKERPEWAKGGGEQFNLLVSHQDQVVTPATGAKVLAGSHFCPIAMTQLGEHMLTFQGHPEFTKSYSEDLMTLRRDVIGEDVYQKGITSLGEDIHAADAARWIVNFLKAG